MGRVPRRIEPARAALLVVDLQVRLLPAMWERERVVREAARLITGVTLLGRPVVVTEQYRKGLGPTVPEVLGAAPGLEPVEKLSFSGHTTEVGARLKDLAVRDVILCGIETHVCVCQTALDLLDAGYRVLFVADACSSRRFEDWRLGQERMRAAGALPASVEMVLFELLQRAGGEAFKQILQLVK